jgi:hypothetical protein
MKSQIIRFVLPLVLFAATLHAGGDGKSTAGKGVEGPDGARLWAQTCTRCHNSRPATSFSDSQWDVIVHHMRVRANLTGSESRAIAEFLKEGN